VIVPSVETKIDKNPDVIYDYPKTIIKIENSRTKKAKEIM